MDHTGNYFSNLTMYPPPAPPRAPHRAGAAPVSRFRVPSGVLLYSFYSAVFVPQFLLHSFCSKVLLCSFCSTVFIPPLRQALRPNGQCGRIKVAIRMKQGGMSMGKEFTDSYDEAFHKEHFDSIQALRGIASLLVILVHIRFLNRNAFAVGVDIFFCISGFMIMFSTHTGPKYFLRKRLFRILPLYYLMTIGTFFLLVLFPGMFQESRANPVFLLKSLLFIPFDPGGGLIQPLMRVGWTINYEILFYIIFFLAMKISQAQRPAVQRLSSGHNKCLAAAVCPPARVIRAPHFLWEPCHAGIRSGNPALSRGTEAVQTFPDIGIPPRLSAYIHDMYHRGLYRPAGHRSHCRCTGLLQTPPMGSPCGGHCPMHLRHRALSGKNSLFYGSAGQRQFFSLSATLLPCHAAGQDGI